MNRVGRELKFSLAPAERAAQAGNQEVKQCPHNVWLAEVPGERTTTPTGLTGTLGCVLTIFPFRLFVKAASWLISAGDVAGVFFHLARSDGVLLKQARVYGSHRPISEG